MGRKFSVSIGRRYRTGLEGGGRGELEGFQVGNLVSWDPFSPWGNPKEGI